MDAAADGIGVAHVLSYEAAPAVRAGKVRLILGAYEPDGLPGPPGACGAGHASLEDAELPRLRGGPPALSARRAAGGRRPQSFVTAIQSTSTSKGPVHSGTQKKMRAGGFFGKKRL